MRDEHCYGVLAIFEMGWSWHGPSKWAKDGKVKEKSEKTMSM